MTDEIQIIKDTWGDQAVLDDAPQLVVDVDGFEGPMDLLLTLAREQKVDLIKISILQLAEQYLGYIDKIRQRRIEIAAEYLVMAAWLAYLKSRLLLPDPPEDENDEPTGEELAALLQFRLQRLEAARTACKALMNRPQQGISFFPRGAPEVYESKAQIDFDVSIFDLLKAYVGRRQKNEIIPLQVKKRQHWSLRDAYDILENLLGPDVPWTDLRAFLGPYMRESGQSRDILAASFAATLEMVKAGRVELRQSKPLGPLYLRTAKAEEETETPDS